MHGLPVRNDHTREPDDEREYNQGDRQAGEQRPQLGALFLRHHRWAPSRLETFNGNQPSFGMRATKWPRNCCSVTGRRSSVLFASPLVMNSRWPSVAVWISMTRWRTRE